MEDNKQVVEETTKPVETQTTDDKKQDEGKVQNDKTFTQEELNKIIEERLAKVKKSLPPKEKLEAYKKWEEEQKTEAEKQAEKEKAVNEQIKNYQSLVIQAKVNDPELADFVQYKVSQMEGDFKDNLEKFLADNPKYTQIAQAEQKGVTHPRVTQTTSSGRSDWEERFKKDYGKYPDEVRKIQY